MDLAQIRQQLEAKQRELTDHVARLQSEARESRDAEVIDEMDDVTASTGQAEAYEESTLEYATLAEIRDALVRLDDGTYGVCQTCGEPIGPARLEAVPWARNCLRDQELLEQQAQMAKSSQNDIA